MKNGFGGLKNKINQTWKIKNPWKNCLCCLHSECVGGVST